MATESPRGSENVDTVTVAVNRKGQPMIPHQTGDSLLKRLIKMEDELDTLLAHLKAVVANGKSDPSWDGWIHALEALIPGTDVHRGQTVARLRESGLHGLAERLEFFGKDGGSWTDSQRERDQEDESDG